MNRETRYRILYLSYLTGIGGGETSLLSLVENLDRGRFYPMVLCPQTGPLVDELCRRHIEVGIAPFRNPRRYFKLFPVISVPFMLNLWQSVQSQQIALIHVNDFESGFYAGIVAKIARLPVVWTCHGWWYAAGGWKALFYRHFFTKIVAVSQAVRIRLLQSAPILPPEQVEVIYPGVDVKRFHPAHRSAAIREEFDFEPHTPLVSIVGRFQEIKGHRFFLVAALKILQHQPDARFLIVGGNPFQVGEDEETERKIWAFVDSYPSLKQRVIFTGFRHDIPDIIASSDVIVCASLAESFGMIHLEAMACGTPIVSTNVGGPLETVVDGKTGFLVPPGDPLAIAEAVLRLLQDKELRETMGREGRQRVETYFSLATYVDKMEKLYLGLLSPRGMPVSP